jgi:hypothetical protein
MNYVMLETSALLSLSLLNDCSGPLCKHFKVIGRNPGVAILALAHYNHSGRGIVYARLSLENRDL